MGDKRISREYDEEQLRSFTVGVLGDLKALEKMLDGGMMEEDVRRIGAEQEMFLVDSSMHPAGVAEEVIRIAGDRRLTTEIGRFNLEANLTPRRFEGDALGAMEQELYELLDIVRTAARSEEHTSELQSH